MKGKTTAKMTINGQEFHLTYTWIIVMNGGELEVIVWEENPDPQVASEFIGKWCVESTMKAKSHVARLAQRELVNMALSAVSIHEVTE